MTRMRAMYDGAAGYVTSYEIDDEPSATWLPPGASEPEPTTIDPDDRPMMERVKAAVHAFVVQRNADAWPPCEVCLEPCLSQLEHTEDNGGRPWPKCSGCLPHEAPFLPSEDEP
jgi:hypothetical protein